MTWTKLDDQFADHPRVISLPLESRWYLVQALIYCGRYNRDGHLPTGVIPPKQAEILVQAEWLEPQADTSFFIPEWRLFHRSASEVEAERQRKANAGRASARARAEQGVEQPVEQESNSTDVRPVPVPDPVVPDPTTPTQVQGLARPPDRIFEILFTLDAGLPYSAENRETFPPAALKSLNTAAGEIRRTRVTPEQLTAAITAWPKVMGDATCTAHAVAKHLPRLRAASNGRVAKVTGTGTKRGDAVSDDLERSLAQATEERARETA